MHVEGPDLNLEAFGKQLIEGHMLPITCRAGETWGKGLKSRSEVSAFRNGCMGLSKYLHSTSKIQAVSKVLCQTPWKSCLAWGRSPGEEAAGRLGMLQLHFPPGCINSTFGGCSEGGPASLPCTEWLKMMSFHSTSCSFVGREWGFPRWAFTR